MQIAVFDIETDGLFDELTEIHCAVVKTFPQGATYKFRPDNIFELPKLLMASDLVVGQNILDFDLPAIRKLYPMGRVRAIDTLILASMAYPNRLQQSLDSWGQTLGELKGAYGKSGKDCWDAFNEDMLAYCEQDVVVTVKLFNHLMQTMGIESFNQLPFIEV